MNLRLALSAAIALLVSAPAFADPPDFDRPGAGFATTVLPAGTVALEQGLPTYERQREDGYLDRTYSADSLIRVGLGGPIELQVGGSAWNRLEERGQGSPLEAAFLPIIPSCRPPYGATVEGYEVVEEEMTKAMDSILQNGRDPAAARK